MTETYISNGRHYNVSQENLERFLTDHPEAEKKENAQITAYYNREGDKWKKYNVAGRNLEKFKVDFPEARTPEGWEKYGKDQEAKYNALIKSEKERKEQNKKDLENKNKLKKEEQIQLQKDNEEKIKKEFKHQFNQDTGTLTVNRSKVINNANAWSLEDKVKWLNEKFPDKNYQAELSFEDPEFEIDENVLDETKLDIPTPMVVMGITSDEVKSTEETDLSNDFSQQIEAWNSSIQNVLKNPILKENGEVDYKATQNAIDKIEANSPTGLDVRDDIDDALSWEQLNEAERRRYKQLLNEIEANPNLKDMEVQYDGFGRPIPQLVQGVDPNDKTLPYNFSDEQKRKHIFDIILRERKQKLEQYKKGEIELTSEELSQISVADQGMIDYVKKFLPSEEELVALENPELSDEENALEALRSATTAAVTSDPRFKFIQDGVLKEVNKEAKAKLEEIRDKYDLLNNPTTENLEKVQDEFGNWFNESVSEKLSNNKSLKNIYQEYGLASSELISEVKSDLQIEKDAHLRQLDDTLDRYENDKSVRGLLKYYVAKGKATWRQTMTSGNLPSTWGNELQIALKNLFFVDPAREDIERTKSVIGNNGITADTTIGEAKLLWRENPDNVNEMGDQTLLPISEFGWKVNNDDTVGEVLKKQEDYLRSWTDKDYQDDNFWETTDVDLIERLEAYENIGKYERFKADSDEPFGKVGSWKDYFLGKQGFLPDYSFTLEGFLDRGVGFIEQAPHMAPSMLGKFMVGAAGVATVASGGSASGLTATAAKVGTGLIALGSMVQGAMEYGSTYMDGIQRGLTEELGREPTAEEYIEALKNPDAYTSQGAAITTGAMVTGVEFISDYLTGKLTGTIGGSIASTSAGKKILGNTFSRYLASVVGSGFGGQTLNAAQEYVTEGFQEYLGQVADNYIDKFAQGKTVDNIFTSNLKWDEIEQAANMGYKQGELFGGVALVSTTLGLSQIQKSNIQVAEEIAAKIDMNPDSKTFGAADEAFKVLVSQIKADKDLSVSEKNKQIKEISRIREAAIIVPSNVTGSNKTKLMRLLMEQKRLENEIKSVNNKQLSVNKIERKAEVDQQIENIIKGADERANTVGMSILPTGQKQTIDTKSETDSYSKLDKLYADEDFDIDNVLDQRRVLKEAGGTINSRLNQLWIKDSLLTRDEFKTALENEYLKTFKGYNPDQDVNMQGIGRQTANLFFERSKALVEENKRKDKTISMSDEKAPEIGDTTRQKDFDAKTEQVVGKRDKRYIGSNEKVNEAVGGDTKGQIQAESAKQILVQAAKGSTADQTSSFINNMFDHRIKVGIPGMFDILGKKIGSFKKGYQGFIDNVVDAEFISQLPSAYIKQSALGKILGVEKIGKSDKVVVKEDGKKSYSRPDTFLLPGEITDQMVQDVKDYLKRNNAIRERFLKKLSSEFAMESLQELKVDKDFMKKLQTALGEGQSAVDFMNDLESKMDQRTLEDSTLDVTTPVKAGEKAIDDIVKDENFKDKDVLDKAIEYFEGLDDDFKNTLGINPIQVFIKAIEASLKGIRRLLNSGSTLSQAIREGKKIFKRALDFPISLMSKFGKISRTPIDKYLRNLGTQKLGFEQKFERGKTPGKIHERLTDREKQIRDQGLKDNWKKLGPQLFFSDTWTGQNDSLYKNMQEIYAVIGDGNIEEGKRLIKEAKANGEFGVDINSDGTSVLRNAQTEMSGNNMYRDWPLSKFEKLAKDPKWRKLQNDKTKVLKNIAKVIEADLEGKKGQDFKDRLTFWGSFLDTQVNLTTHPLRALAPIRFFTVKNVFGKGKAVMEHTMPANLVAKSILDMAKRGKVDQEFKVIEKSYFQGKLDGESDLMLKITEDNIDLRKAMPNRFFDLFDPSTWLRYVEDVVRNNSKGGINLNELKSYKADGTLTTVANELGLGLKKDQYEKFPNLGGITLFGLIKFQNELIYKVSTNQMSLQNAQSLLKTAVDSGVKAAEQKMVTQNAQGFGSIFSEFVTPFFQKNTMLNSLAARIQALKINKKRKGLSAFDMDDTLALTKEKVIAMSPAAQFDLEMINETGNQILREKLKKEFYNSNKVKYMSAAEYAQKYESLLEKGWVFDYKNFDNVDLSTSKGPLAGTALARQAKYGAKDIYIVTARPNASQKAIKIWADSIGLNIPLENIITLEDGSPMAKADWLIEKAKQGYNDFYFADDSAMNVQVVKDILSQIDVKSKVQLAITEKATDIDTKMNEIIEDATDIEANTEVTDVEARLEGKKRDKGFLKRILRQFTITSSADDFLGLGYKLFGFGKKGTDQQTWFIDNLIKPYNKAEQLVISAKVTIANDFVALKKAFPKLMNYGLGKTKNPLNDQIGYKYFTVGQAIRVYLWNKQGMDIPGMSKTDIDSLVEAVESESQYNVFADELQLIQKQAEYPGPTTNWMVGNIKSDILSGIDTKFRSELLTEWNENIDIAFSDKNMNKLEKAFGSKYVEAIRDSIKRMRSGSNRPTYEGSGSRQVNEMMDWLNGSVAVAMFLNVRSGSLQMLSNVNFINWGDNNIYAAAKAFVSKDYVPTVMKLMNSDYLVNRRDGLKINVNEAELAAAAKQGGFKGMLNYLLDKGFILTRIFDSLAIATGGATFFINRTKANLKRVNAETGKLYTQAEAEAAAFDDFYAIAEETQQSSNPSKISSQQASLFGRVILAFQNVTMQYNRKAKKMLLDFIKRRKRPGMTQRESDLSNLSGVIYYVGVQNLVFNSLQQALFALVFDEDDEREKDKVANTIHGMMDSLLFGLGFGGAIVSTLKNVARELNFQHGRKNPKYEEAVWNLFDISPVIDQKVRNVRTALRTFSWNRKEIKKRGWSLENPAYLAISQLISAFTNVPIDRALRKYNNINQAFDEETRTFERVALLLGWNGWNFGLPYWGRESTIQQELQDEETLKNNFKADVRKAKKDGFTKRVPFTGPNSGKPKGVLGVDYVQIERYDGMIQYYKKP